MRILVIYGTTEGHTRKIAETMATQLRERLHRVDLFDAATAPADIDVAAYDAVMIAASVHQRAHQAAVVRFVVANRETLQSRPGAFVSVSLAAVMRDASEDAQGYVDSFLDETGWKPLRTLLLGGALLYPEYDFLKRQVMRLIVWRAGGPTNTHQDYDYTDWAELTSFVDEFLEAANA
jgi:menaquinone-dependent protoporphyrinogen oxidase